jgi:3-deoxy-7-phosphoheptulonate synthase
LLKHSAHDTVIKGRNEVTRILNGLDNRLLVVVGPCSIHDADAAMDYATRLKGLADELKVFKSTCGSFLIV